VQNHQEKRPRDGDLRESQAQAEAGLSPAGFPQINKTVVKATSEKERVK
jgi:hypothetical protein